ncbi:uncharacterized protein LOC124355877 [Homalodisca vitripennis]|uniref:uncharacterized protein LOC124355877 n=1 Tax=Homalodisca vitripennis TaxID=197043 RepID=UPI001EEC33A0|nr:uncharacterized protein LOC124355877 [Homalodisca vitripennis]
MGNYHKLPDVQEVEEQEEEENSTICSAKSTRHQRKDHDKIPLQYTNRRRVERVSADSSKSNEERKKENEQEFENIRSQIEDYSISKGHSSQRSNNRKSCSASQQCLLIRQLSSCYRSLRRVLDNGRRYFSPPSPARPRPRRQEALLDLDPSPELFSTQRAEKLIIRTIIKV